MTEKEKLIQLIKAAHEKASDYFHKEAMAILKQGKSYSSKDRTKTFDEFVADTLIENSIGDIAEWKRRAEVAEEIAKKACDIVFSQEIDGEDWENVICLYKEENEKYCDEIGITEDMLYDYLKEKSKRDIKEKRK